MKTRITDLEEMFQAWAWDQYLNTSTGLLSRLFSRKLKKKHATIELNWDKVKFITLKPKYEELPNNKSAVKVVVESEYENETNEDQTHSFRTERETVSTATFNLTKGYSRSANVGLQVNLPEDMLDADPNTQDKTTQRRKQMATASFGNSLHVDTEEGNTVEKSLKWAVDTTITSRNNNLTIARLEVEETNSAYQFSVRVRAKGRIVAVIRDARGEGKLIQTVEGDVATVLNDINNGGSNRLKDVEFNMDHRYAELPVEGNVDFKYGVSQRVKVAYGNMGSTVVPLSGTLYPSPHIHGNQ